MTLLIQLLPVLATMSDNEGGMYMGGGLLVIIVASLLIQIPYKHFDKIVKNTTYYKNPPAVQNELDYADYIQWATANNHPVFFNKMSPDEMYNEDEDE